MDLFKKACEFNKLCKISLKKKAYDPSIPKSKPKSEMPPFTDIAHFAMDLMQFDLSKYPGVSVDVNDLKSAGFSLYAAFKDYQKNDKLAENIVKALEKILTLTNNGGGSLYNKTKNFITQVKNIISSEKQKNSVTKQEPAPWLKNYMDKTKTPPAWLNQYMAENEAKEMENGMQSSLQEGNSVQNSLNHTSYFPNFEKD